MRVVMIDAPDELRLPLEAALRASGCRVRDSAPDVVVLAATDLDTIRRVALKQREVPIIVVVPRELLISAFGAGADDCVTQETPVEEIVARIHAALRRAAVRARASRRDRKLSDELRALQREKIDLERAVCVDALTGIANRRHALSLLSSEYKRSARDATPLSVVMVDLDYFHAFNEQYGHPGGDACLRRVTGAMVTCLRRPSDLLGRYGGEEFLVVLAGTDAAGAAIVAARLRNAVEMLQIPHARSECSHVVTISAGFASCRPHAGGDEAELVAAADDALLAAKAAGRNRTNGEHPGPEPREKKSSEPWRRFPIVVAEPWFATHIPAFLEGARDGIRELREALAGGEFDRIRSYVRPLRANASKYGFEPIVHLGALLETAARGNDAVSAARIIDELEAYLAHVQVAYRRPLEHAG